jgi:hypothetical protein
MGGRGVRRGVGLLPPSIYIYIQRKVLHQKLLKKGKPTRKKIGFLLVCALKVIGQKTVLWITPLLVLGV